MSAHSGIVAAVTLPWPSADLSPNARVHWARRSRAARKARHDAKVACLAAGIRGLGWDAARVAVTFHPPGNYRYDDDNLISRCKPLFDGIADATGIDDSKWRLAAPERGEATPGGSVVVRLSPLPAAGDAA